MIETMAYAQERYKEMVTRGLANARDARVKEAEAATADSAVAVRWGERLRLLLAQQLRGFATRLAPPTA